MVPVVSDSLCLRAWPMAGGYWSLPSLMALISSSLITHRGGGPQAPTLKPAGPQPANPQALAVAALPKRNLARVSSLESRELKQLTSDITR